MSQSNYGFWEIIKNIVYVLRTKMMVPKARMLRFPIVIRGKHYIDFGNNLTTGARCRIEVHGDHGEKVLMFGNNVNIGYDVRISCCERIRIGNDVLIGSRVLITDNCHGCYKGENQDCPDTPPNKRKLLSSAVDIENNVWIGENAIIQMGVTIGYGSIIAANSVVTKDVEPKSMVAGMPAAVIKKYDESAKEWRRI